ncbi:ATP-grasp domain-containing protein [Curvivirga aplysinae]|uniref:ATP-grasp domain-containing protein n=1 Tax=Curvivirga aplysinae TaxID=2529852 RepID=UPI001C3F61CA|nr:ATP-grasp domain-containing protein [Curvivirga aplysinae]
MSDLSIENAINPTSAGKLMHQGMPPLEMDGPALSHFEFWSPRVFYIPIVLQTIWLSLRHMGATLPTSANPHFPMGGLVGESKKIVLSLAGETAKEFISPFTQITKGESEDIISLAEKRMSEAGLTFPLVAKPDMGCRGVGVQIARSSEELITYIDSFPDDASILLQELVPYEAEAGVFYIREPDQEKGRIFSVTLKYFPYVIGDGTRNLRQLIEEDERAGQISHVYLKRHESRLDEIIPAGQPYRLAFAGSHSRGTIFRDGRPYVTKAMTDAFDKIAKDIPEFYFGRFDVRFTNVEDLQQGKNFKIVEVNGAGGEATHIWDRKITLREAYKTLFEQYATLYRIGAKNRKRGFKPASLWRLTKAWQEEKRLVADYPHTE